jgi:hypothetical protein
MITVRAFRGSVRHQTTGGRPWAYDDAPFTPAYILPVQASPREQIKSPEKRLMAAVLMQAVDDLRLARATRLQGLRQRNGHGSESWVADVEEWFASHDGRWPFSFERICAGLGIDADAIRDALRRVPRWSAGNLRRNTPASGAAVAAVPRDGRDILGDR